MLCGVYHFHCRFLTKAILPPYKGSTFRGVFGRALRKVVCTQNTPSCDACKLKNRCLYVLVFETELTPIETRNPRSSARPHPFVIEPPMDTHTCYKPGKAFHFNLILFGHVNHNLPYFIYAFEKMGTIGLGRQIKGRRGKFRLEQVSFQEKIIYTYNNKFLPNSGLQTQLDMDPISEFADQPHTVKVKLVTPLRLKFKNKYHAQLPFHLLVRASLRRMSSLMNFYGDGEPDIDYPGLVRCAEKIKYETESLRWFDWRRYSFRQDQAMFMGGMVGEVIYKRVPGEFIRLLEFIEKTHLGKQSSFGLGKIQLAYDSK